MHRKPRNPRAGIFTRPLLVLLLTGGVWSAVVNISLFAWLLSTDRPVEQAIAITFVSLVLIQFFKAYNYRSDRLSVLSARCESLAQSRSWKLLLGVIIRASASTLRSAFTQRRRLDPGHRAGLHRRARARSGQVDGAS
jgi:Ca2+-transporting ATPase